MEIAGDVNARITALEVFGSVTSLVATEFATVLQRVGVLVAFPACLVILRSAEYEGGRPMTCQRARTVLVNCLMVGEVSADIDADSDTVWGYADTVARAFLPAAGANQPVVLNDVIYHPDAIEAVRTGNDNLAALNLRLQAIDAMQDGRSDI